MEVDKRTLLEQLEQSVKVAQEEVSTKLSSFGPSEFASFMGKWKEIRSRDDYMQSREAFLLQFDNYNPCYKSHYFYNDVEVSLKKEVEIPANQRASLVNFFQKHIEVVKNRRNIISKRVSTAIELPKHESRFKHYVKNIGNYLYQCESALETIESSSEANLTRDQIMFAVKEEYGKAAREFPLRAFHSAMKLFPLTRRTQILEKSYERFMCDLRHVQTPLAQYPQSCEELRKELERLSSVLEIEFDLETHDGHKFYYSCDKLFTDVFRTPIDVPSYEYLTLRDDFADLRKIIDFDVMKHTERDPLAESMWEQFSVMSADDITSIIGIVLSRKTHPGKDMKEYMNIFLKLEFIRNKVLFKMLAEKIREVECVRKKYASDDVDYYQEKMSLVRMYCIAALSKLFAKNPETANKEVIFENFMHFAVKYFTAKMEILKYMEVVLMHVPSKEVIATTMKIIDEFPILLDSPIFSCMEQFQLAVDEYEAQLEVIETLLNMQMVHESRLYGEIRDCRYVDCDEYYPESVFPITVFQIFESLGIMNRFISDVPEIAMEFCQTVPIKWRRMFGHIKLAVWQQLMHEIRNIKENPLYPYQIFAVNEFAGVSSNVGSFFTSDYVKMWSAIEDLVDSVEEAKKVDVLLSARKFVFICNKMKLYIYKSQFLLESYCKQRKNSPMNLEEMSEVLDFISPLVSFDNKEKTREFIIAGDFALLRRSVDAQRRYNVMMSVAIRFNNFYGDANFLCSYFRIDDTFVHYKNIDEVDFRDEMKLKHFAVGFTVARAKRLRDTELSKLFCNIRDTTDCTATEKVINAVMPFAYRIELAQLCSLERQFFAVLASKNAFTLDTGSSFLSENGRVLPNVIPYVHWCLSINRGNDDLQTLIKFMSIRLHMLYLIRIESVMTQRINRVFEGIFIDNLIWDIAFFSNLNADIIANEGNELHQITSTYEQVEYVLANRMCVILLEVLDDVYSVTDQKKRRNFENCNSEMSLKRWWNSMCHSVWSPLKFMTSKRYIPNSYDQLVFQVEEFARAEVGAQFQCHDNYVNDALREVPKKDIYTAKGNFEHTLLKGHLLKYVFMLAQGDHHPDTLNPVSVIMLINQKCLKSGQQAFQNHISVKTAQKLAVLSKKHNTEMRLLLETNSAYRQPLEEYLTRFQLTEFKAMYSVLTEDISKAVNAPNALLKPECYTKAAQKSRRMKEVYIPAPTDSDRQFHQELHFAIGKLLFSVQDALNARKNNSGDYIIDREWLCETLKSLTPMVDLIGSGSLENLASTWNCYIRHAMNTFNEHLDNHTIMSFFNRYLTKGLESHTNYDLSVRLRDDIFTLNSLRFTKKVKKQLQQREEYEITRATKQDFEQLITDLNAEIKACKKAYYDTYTHFYNTALTQIENLLKDSDRMDEIMSQKTIRSNEERAEKVKIEEEKLQKLLRQMRISRCMERLGSTEYYTRRIDKVGEERKSFSASLWFGRRQFEEEQLSKEDELATYYQQLTNCQIEIEALNQKLEYEKRHTAQLIHLRGMSLKKYDQMLLEEKRLQKIGEINVTQLLQKLSDAHDELELLIEETDEFDAEFTYQVREPMAECDRCRKRIMRIAAANYERQKAPAPEPESPYLSKLISDNAFLKRENDDLKQKIEELEQAKQELNAESRRQLEKLFEPLPKQQVFQRRPPATARAANRRLVKPTNQTKVKTPRS